MSCHGRSYRGLPLLHKNPAQHAKDRVSALYVPSLLVIEVGILRPGSGNSSRVEEIMDAPLPLHAGERSVENLTVRVVNPYLL